MAGKDERAERLAQRLRENLRRRKALARERDAAGENAVGASADQRPTISDPTE
jgi:hypothetical protein